MSSRRLCVKSIRGIRRRLHRNCQCHRRLVLLLSGYDVSVGVEMRQDLTTSAQPTSDFCTSSVVTCNRRSFSRPRLPRIPKLSILHEEFLSRAGGTLQPGGEGSRAWWFHSNCPISASQLRLRQRSERECDVFMRPPNPSSLKPRVCYSVNTQS
jgi:hypothetical protein